MKKTFWVSLIEFAAEEGLWQRSLHLCATGKPLISLKKKRSYKAINFQLGCQLPCHWAPHAAVWAFLTICSAFAPLPSPSSTPDWFLCALCHPAADKWCCLLHQQNSQYLIHFQFWAPAVVCVTGCFVGTFARKLTPQLIAPLIETSLLAGASILKQPC